MAWKSLKDPRGSNYLDDKPRVLAGPILRQVTPTSVTVWLALRKPGAVTLKVLDADGNRVMEGKRRAVAIGANLHIVAVTAKQAPRGAALTEGVVYRYDLIFDFDDNLSTNLATATAPANLSYFPPPFALPSFALPPQDQNRLRLIQGSCRMPHAAGKDTFPLIDDLIAETASNAFARPHQLLLTGDQIYADDVSDALLLLLTDASDTLLGWVETLPGVNLPSAQLPPFWRELPLSQVGFTSVDLRSHLLSLGEYLSMYLFVWSGVLWPPSSGLPTFDEIMDKVKFGGPPVEDPFYSVMVPLAAAERKKSIESDTKAIAEFSQELFKVRRALANIPSYMIFDDHEVTDDWNMTRKFCRKVYGSDLGLGMRVVQNALVAYSLCQHWGNVPEDFVSSKPGGSLLALIDTPQPTATNAFQHKAANYDGISKDLRKLLGIHDAATLKAHNDHAVFHDSGSLRYDFSVEGTGHQVIFTDTRTWRSFPRKADGTHLLTKNQQTDQFKQQILDAPDTLDRLLFVVLTTNAPPVQPIRAATRHDRISNGLKHFPDVYEAWDLPSVSFDRLLVALTSKLPLDESNQHTGPVILLSGDVHHSFASRIMYRATKRYEDDAQPRAATAVIAQLVASPFKKQNDDTVRFLKEGYYAAPYPWVSQRMIRHTLTEGYVGWNFPKGANEEVCTVSLGVMRLPLFVDKRTIDVSQTDEQLSGQFDSRTVDLIKAAHYRYRLDYLLPTKQFVQIPVGPFPPLPAAGSSLEVRKKWVRQFDSAIKSLRDYNLLKPAIVVGVNNFGEIRLLDWGVAASRKVNHILRWRNPKDGNLKLTIYSVRLDINSPTDNEFFDIKARSGE
jgi:hypothetical protein